MGGKSTQTQVIGDRSQTVNSVLELIGSHIDEVSKYAIFSEHYFVVDESQIIVDVLFKGYFCSGYNMTSLNTFDSYGFGKIVHLHEYHKIRHFDKTGDCDFRFLMRIEE